MKKRGTYDKDVYLRTTETALFILEEHVPKIVEYKWARGRRTWSLTNTGKVVAETQLGKK